MCKAFYHRCDDDPKLFSLTARPAHRKIRPSKRVTAPARWGPRKPGRNGVRLPIMALATLLERLTLDLLPRLFWVLMNNKVVGLVSGTAACILICKTDGRFRGQRALAI